MATVERSTDLTTVSDFFLLFFFVINEHNQHTSLCNSIMIFVLVANYVQVLLEIHVVVL